MKTKILLGAMCMFLLVFIASVNADTYATTSPMVYGVTTEVDPLYQAWDKSTGITITETQITDLTHTTDTNETTRMNEIYTYTTTNRSLWDLAYGWGNHALAGYLTTYTDTNETTRVDDLYSNIFGWFNISDFNITDYYLASNPDGFYNSSTLPAYTDTNETTRVDDLYSNIFGWYNSSDFNIANYYSNNNPDGYYNSSTLPAYTDTNETTRMNAIYDYVIANRSNWDEAFSWGDHADEGYLTSFTELDPDYYSNPNAY